MKPKTTDFTTISDPNTNPSPRIKDKPERRKFTSEYKLAILKELSACKGKPGAIGKVIRREGLFSSQVTEWRRAVEEGQETALHKRRGPKIDATEALQRELITLQEKHKRLEQRLRCAEGIIEIQKKISEMLAND